MSSREEFEAWLSREYPWGNEALDKAFFSGNDDNGYYTGGDFIYDGSSCADALFWAWRGWQESHKRAEAKCGALAAENAGLKQFPDQIVGFIVKLGSSEIGAETKERIEAAAKKIKTPATDSFLAEVRAQGVEMFAEQQRSFIGKPSKNDAASSYSSREAIIVANALSGDALDAMFKTLGEAAPLGTNNAQQQKETGAPNPAEYFK